MDHQADDVDGAARRAGHIVKATRHAQRLVPAQRRRFFEPIAPGTLLEIVEIRPWGAAMAQELPQMHDALNVADEDEWEAIKQAATELAEIGLWEFVEATG